MGRLTVRAVTDADLPVVAGIFAHYVMHSLATFDEHPPAVSAWEHKREELSARGLPFLVAEVGGHAAGTGGHVAGYAFASLWRGKPGYRYTAEDTVYVAPESTGQGAGRLLLQAVIQECAAIGIRQLVAVIADAGTPASLALHRACGFTEAGRLRSVGYKHDRWIDTVLMQRELTR
jgi:phosphinothricin acetyltransferase